MSLPGLAPSVVMGAAAGAFSPGDYNPLLWFDPSDSSTLWQNSDGTGAVSVGDPIGKIEDKGSSGEDASQATASARPTLQEPSTGKFAIRGDGSNDYLENTTAQLPLNNQNHLFIVSSEITAIQNSGIFTINPSSGEDWLSSDGRTFTNGNSTGVFEVFGAGVFRNRSTADEGLADGAPSPLVIWEIVVAGTAAALYRNGVYLSEDGSLGATGLSAGGFLLLARYLNGADLWANTDIYGIIMYDGTLTSGQADDVREWLADKAGITL